MTAEMIAAIFTGVNGLLVVLGGIYLQKMSKEIAATKALTEVSVKDGREIKALVNGPYGEVLRENAELRAFKAAVTQDLAEKALASRAQETSDTHNANAERVIAAIGTPVEAEKPRP